MADKERDKSIGIEEKIKEIMTKERIAITRRKRGRSFDGEMQAGGKS